MNMTKNYSLWFFKIHQILVMFITNHHKLSASHFGEKQPWIQRQDRPSKIPKPRPSTPKWFSERCKWALRGALLWRPAVVQIGGFAMWTPNSWRIWRVYPGKSHENLDDLH